MASWKLVTFLAVAVSCTSALEVRHVRSSRVSAASTTELPTAPFSIALTDKAPRSSYKKQLLRELRSGGKSKTAVVDGSGDDEEYLTDIVVGGQSFKVIVDTGRCVALASVMLLSSHLPVIARIPGWRTKVSNASRLTTLLNLLPIAFLGPRALTRPSQRLSFPCRIRTSISRTGMASS